MRIFLYEQITATYGESHPLYREGRAMRDALHADLSCIASFELLEGEFEHCAAHADGCILIAPETGGILESLARHVLDLGGRLFGCSPEAIRHTADKLALAELWQRCGVPTPHTQIATADFDTFPVVLKPRDGAGSECTRLVTDRTGELSLMKRPPIGMIVQPFIPGIPASIAFLIGPNQIVPLCPTHQRLSDDGCFQYLGGELPLPPLLAARAIRLGLTAIAAVPAGLIGYVGVDLILGDAVDGSTDFAIEINPRLTTSYIGLRAATQANLAEAMLMLCQGSPVAKPEWRAGAFRWASD